MRPAVDLRCLLIGITAVIIGGCHSTPPEAAPLTPFSASEAREFYLRYEAALKTHRRDTIAHFYHADGALIILNGTRTRRTKAGIDSIYRGPWQGPAFFTFDSLRFEPLGSKQVLVTGGFRWLVTQSPDTLRFTYLSVLDPTPSGLKIVVEHETILTHGR